LKLGDQDKNRLKNICNINHHVFSLGAFMERDNESGVISPLSQYSPLVNTMVDNAIHSPPELPEIHSIFCIQVSHLDITELQQKINNCLESVNASYSYNTRLFTWTGTYRTVDSCHFEITIYSVNSVNSVNGNCVELNRVEGCRHSFAQLYNFITPFNISNADPLGSALLNVIR
jgi:hypothetical protein